MDSEALSYVPREERPSLEDLEGYTESRFDPDPDYTLYLKELHVWLHDWRREQEQKRQDGKELLPLHGDPEQRTGYDEATFFDDVKKKIKSRGLH